MPGDGQAVIAAKVEALEALSDVIEDIDNASDFVKIGGVSVCYAALASSHEAIRAEALVHWGHIDYIRCISTLCSDCVIRPIVQ